VCIRRREKGKPVSQGGIAKPKKGAS
jgi:hypothetical protein